MQRNRSRHFLQLVALSFGTLALASVSAYATPVSYGLTLTPFATSGNGNISGTGTLTLDTPIPATGSFSASNTGTDTMYMTKIDALSFTLSDGTMFSLAKNGGSASASFNNDMLTNISFSYYGPQLPSFSIQGSPGPGGQYAYVTSYSSSSGATYGSFTFNSTPLIATPEPASLLMAAPALLVGFLKLRKGSRAA